MVENTNYFNASLLVIDDEEMNLILLEEILEMEKFQNVTFMDDPVKAVESFADKVFDLVLLDLKMPVMDGFAVMEKFKTLRENCPPVLVLTASADADTREKVLNAGAIEVISKPFDHDELIEVIRKILN